ncbi:secreted RxLR effector protein 161-like [Apium graveolens]|uniref:secreted RxLR effector protein 161-like n=1 Tax=Apium graveolens TaxID=4045 RepID=UPI003D790A12
MEPRQQIGKDEKGKEVNPTVFKSLVSGLRYMVHTRSDIEYSVGTISRFMEHPTALHLSVARRILQYVKNTLNCGLVYSKETGNYLLSGYSDSDLAGNIKDGRSTGGMVFYLNEILITWVSQK